MAQHKEFIKLKVHFHRGDKKLKQRHTGPYEVLEQVSDQTYRLDLKADFLRFIAPSVSRCVIVERCGQRTRPEKNYQPTRRTRNKGFNPSQS